MKHFKIILVLLTIGFGTNANAQFWEKLGKKAEKAAERGVQRTVEKRVEKETEKSTDRVLDSVIDAPKNKKKTKKERRKERKQKEKEGTIIGGTSNDPVATTSAPTVNYNFDFPVGNVTLFEDNFDRDTPGDFPVKWDTNGSGEIVLVDSNKWMRLGNSSLFYPIMSTSLPENYTIQFDLLATGLDNKTSSNAMLSLLVQEQDGFNKVGTESIVELSPCQFISSRGVVEKRVDGKRIMRNAMGKDYRDLINGQTKISIAVNKTRMRVWMNDIKLVDIPRLVPEQANYFKLATRGLRDDRNTDQLHIANFVIKTTGEDTRSKLLTEGKLSTSAILFNSGKATIKGGADAILKEVSDAMNQSSSMRIKIVGHTDTDGTSASNLTLSKDRAMTVKNTLVYKYDIAENRIEIHGAGEGNPIADNSTANGKSQNRRVEFIKL